MRKFRFFFVLVATVVAFFSLQQAASAQIFWYGADGNGLWLVNDATGQCATPKGAWYAGMIDCSSQGDPSGFNLVSSAPDAGGHAYVEIQAASRYQGLTWCLKAQGVGPSGVPAGSMDVELAPCNASDPSQIWAMATARPANGSMHYITFFTFGGRVCLDGGIGLYGFREEGCNSSNNYQVWDINY